MSKSAIRFVHTYTNNVIQLSPNERIVGVGQLLTPEGFDGRLIVYIEKVLTDV